MSAPVAFRRQFGDGRSDPAFQPIDLAGCIALQHVWAGRIARGEYVAIELRLANGQRVKVKRLI